MNRRAFFAQPTPGICHCGCGQKTAIAKRTDRTRGIVQGTPRRFVAGHKGSACDRFFQSFREVENDCWEWTNSSVDRGGYGRFAAWGKEHLAHRFSYEMFIGPIPAGLTLDHLCRNRACVNPGHLEPVTNRENVLRGQSIVAEQARKSHCKRGHSLSGANLYVDPKGGRQCRRCTRKRIAEWKRKARAEGRVVR